MLPIYVPLTDTIIRDYGTRYTHPVTGIVYGRTDYDDPAKLAEIGAVALREEQPPAGYSAEVWEIVDDTENPGGKLRRPTSTVEIPAPPADPQWYNFSAALMEGTSVNAMLGAVFQAAPGLYAGLTLGLQKAAVENDSRLFITSWQKAIELKLVSAELIEAVRTLATSYDIPADFIQSLAERETE